MCCINFPWNHRWKGNMLFVELYLTSIYNEYLLLPVYDRRLSIRNDYDLNSRLQLSTRRNMEFEIYLWKIYTSHFSTTHIEFNKNLSMVMSPGNIMINTLYVLPAVWFVLQYGTVCLFILCNLATCYVVVSCTICQPGLFVLELYFQDFWFKFYHVISSPITNDRKGSWISGGTTPWKMYAGSWVGE